MVSKLAIASRWWVIAIAAALHILPAAAPVQAGTAKDGVAGEIAIDREIECLALTIYFEARSEPAAGKLAVGHVVMNRVSSPRYPRQICAVVRQGGEWPKYRCQFSWWCDGRSDSPREIAAWKDSMTVARRIFWGLSADPTAGALYYHATYVEPYWGKLMGTGEKIGQHIFYPPGDGAGMTSAGLEQ